MIDCFWFCFGPVLAFDLLSDLLGHCFGVFGLFYCFGFHSAFSSGFGLGFVCFWFLVSDSSFVHFVSVFLFPSALVSLFISILIVISIIFQFWFFVSYFDLG